MVVLRQGEDKIMLNAQRTAQNVAQLNRYKKKEVVKRVARKIREEDGRAVVDVQSLWCQLTFALDAK